MPGRTVRAPLACALALTLLLQQVACAASDVPTNPSATASPLPVPAASGPPGSAPRDADGRFRNTGDDAVGKGLGEVLRWRWGAWRDDLPPAPQVPTPRVAPDLARLRANAVAGAAMQPAVTWIGHATALVQAGGLNVLTDPIFSERASPFSFIGPKRHLPPGIALGDLPPIDVVLVSHNHYDHLDGESVDALARQPGGPPLYVVPLGLKAWFAERGIARVVELDWWQAVDVNGSAFVLTPVQHWSSRSPTDRMRTLWGGWAVFSPDFQWFFAGDTAWSRDFAEVHARFAARHGGEGRGFDLALIPIGAYEPRWFMAAQHVNPAEAVRIHQTVRATRSIGVHWGTFSLTDEALDEPPRALARAAGEARLAADAFTTIAVGETVVLPRRR